MFKRKIYDKLLDWKRNSDGNSALLIEGARRIGKSTIAEEFAKNEYESYIIIDFAFAKQEVKDLFNDLSDLNYFFLQLQLLYKTDLIERKSLIIFDEVQFCPLARQAIKLLVKDHRYDYIETGSLISISKNVQNILIPSEEQSICMYPMDYEEFLWAIGDNVSSKLLYQSYINKKPLGDAVTRKCMKDFQLYMLVGGMPEAINEYIKTNSFRDVDIVKRDILDVILQDFYTIDKTCRMTKLFTSIPTELKKKGKRFQVASILKNERAINVLNILKDLDNSKAVLLAHQPNDFKNNLYKNYDINIFKMFLCDTGLLVTLIFKDMDFEDNIIYDDLLHNKLNSKFNYLYQNIVAQMLVSNGYELFYYVWENIISKHNYEVNFILTKGDKISPIEIKASGYKAHTSLDEFANKYSDIIANKYLIYTKDLFKNGDILYLPIFLSNYL